jgi:hypothetical protein
MGVTRRLPLVKSPGDSGPSSGPNVATARVALKKRALVLFSMSVATVAAFGTLGCGSKCSSATDSSVTVDLAPVLPGYDAGLEGGVDSLTACEACPIEAIRDPVDACVGSCYFARDSRGVALSRACAYQTCVAVVRDPKSSCDAVCQKVYFGPTDRGCSFNASRTRVTCGYHSEGSCRCTLIDC